MNIRRIVTFAFTLAVVGMIFGFTGCERAPQMVPDDTTTMPETMATEIPIGVVVALTGVHAEPYGLPMQRGFELAREEINAMSPANITFVTEDDQSSVEGTVSAVQSLVDQGVSAFVGTAISTQLKAAYPIAQESGVVGFSSVSSAAGLSSLGDYIFRAALAADTLVPGGVAASQAALGYQKVAVIYDTIDVYSTSVKEEMVKALEINDVEVLTVETVETEDREFTTQLTSIMEANPDAIFVSALIPEMKPIMAQARTLGIPADVPFICAELDGPAVAELGDVAEGSISLLSWHSTSDTPGNQAFLESYRAKYGIEAEPWAAQSYATLHILANAIANAQSRDSAAIRDALAQTMDFPTILGKFSFDPNGEALYDPVVLQVTDGQLQPLE